MQLCINTTIVENSLASTGDTSNPYICNDTYDKVYLLSHMGTYNEYNNKYYNAGGYWLRTPYNGHYRSENYKVREISGYSSGGRLSFEGGPLSYNTTRHCGVVPAITITLTNID